MVALLTLRQMVRDRIGVPPHDDFFRDSVIDSNINLALSAIESEYRWPWNERYDEVTVPTSGEFTVPDDWRATRALMHDLSVLAEMPMYDLATRYTGTTMGSPAHFAVVHDTIYVRPYPSSPIQMRHIYYATPKLLALDIDEPSIPAAHIGTLVAKAAQLCSVREDDRPSADSHLAEYLQGIERMRKEVRGTTRPQRIRVRPGSWLGG